MSNLSIPEYLSYPNLCASAHIVDEIRRLAVLEETEMLQRESDKRDAVEFDTPIESIRELDASLIGPIWRSVLRMSRNDMSKLVEIMHRK